MDAVEIAELDLDGVTGGCAACGDPSHTAQAQPALAKPLWFGR